MAASPKNQNEIRLYLDHSKEMLAVARQNLLNDYYSSAINRAYYAIFYAANALLATIGEARGKHSGVISVFRNRFIKSSEFPAKYSDIYGRVMDNRQRGDYDPGSNVSMEQAKTDLEDARRFVDEVERWLKEKKWV
jgi:uncharacterized protein